MRRIDFDPTRLTAAEEAEWLPRQAKAAEATRAIIEAWENWRNQGSPGEFTFKFQTKANVWTAMKEWLLDNRFNGKCAYCEIVIARADCHAEHFRPKGSVSLWSADGKTRDYAMATDEENRHVRHPGYFWLAFHWQNILPICAGCNKGEGKNDLFPVKNIHGMVSRLSLKKAAALCQPSQQSPRRRGVYYPQPADLDAQEGRLLLHPYFDDPAQHLEFGEFGTVVPRNNSPMGRASIETYFLHEERLKEHRRQACEYTMMKYLAALHPMHAPTVGDRLAHAAEIIRACVEGKTAFSAAVLSYLRLHRIPC